MREKRQRRREEVRQAAPAIRQTILEIERLYDEISGSDGL
jgi:hypothetical protein